MVPRGSPKFFVISAHGEAGPYDQRGLRDALKTGEIAEQDQVRSAFGSPLGTVRRVLNRDSDRSATQAGAPPPAPERSSANPLVLIIASLVVVVGLLALFGIGPTVGPEPRPTPPAPEAPTVRPPVLPPPALPPPVAKPTPPPRPPSAPAVPPTLPPPITTAPPAAEAEALRGNLLRGVNVVRWNRGQGVRITAKNGGIHLEQNGSAMWAGVGILKERQDWRGSRGLILDVQAVDTNRALQFEIIEASNERHIADFRLTPGPDAQEIRLPWTAFRRRDDQRGKKPPDDGLQLDRIIYVALWPAEEAAVSFRIHGLRLER